MLKWMNEVPTFRICIKIGTSDEVYVMQEYGAVSQPRMNAKQQSIRRKAHVQSLMDDHPTF